MSGSIFIRNPKCATISIRGAVRREGFGVRFDELETHQTAAQWKKSTPDLKRYFVFSVCRNPYDRLLSGWLFICRRKLDKHEKILEKYQGDFKLFVTNLHKDFGMKLTDVDMVTWAQVNWFMDEEGNNLVDEIGRFESLSSWWPKLCQRKGWPPVNLSKSNRTNHGPGKEYYTSEMIEIVNEQYADDFKLFNYKML
jgi:hypothetical protein